MKDSYRFLAERQQLGQSDLIRSVPSVLESSGADLSVPDGMTNLDFVAAAAAKSRLLLAQDRHYNAGLFRSGQPLVTRGFIGLEADEIASRGDRQAQLACQILDFSGLELADTKEVPAFAASVLIKQVSAVEQIVFNLNSQ